jgi:beta-galactosidase
MPSIPGWQFSSTNATFVDNTLRDIRTMVRWYRNHPSVIAWEVLHNESYDPVDQIKAYNTTAHQEYPGNQMYTCGEEKYACDESYGIVDLLINSTQHDVRGYTKSWPMAISESADCEYGCTSGTSRRGRPDQDSGMWEQARNHIETLNLDRGMPWLTGDAVWSMFDYAGYERTPYSRCGISDVYRMPKISYYFHQSQRDPSVIIPGVNSGPMVYIAKYWTPRYTNLPVRVFSNCDSVCLYLNGTLVAEQAPDLVMQGFDKPLPVDRLLHAPFTFSTVGYQPGTLSAEGRIGGAVKATHEVRTPGTASKISVQIDTAGLPFLADGADVAFVYASVLDQNGTLVTTANNSIQFSVTGGTILGPSPQPAAAGIAVILLQTKTTAGEITVTAGSRGLTSGSASVTSVPYVDPSCVEAGTVFQPKAPSTQH